MTKNTKLVHSKINKRSTDVQIQVTLKRVIYLMGQNLTTRDICEVLGPELGKSDKQIQRYVSKATEMLQNDFARDAHIRRMEMEQSIRMDLIEAYKIFIVLDHDDKLKAVWYKLIMDTKSKLENYTPADISTDKGQTISITYNKADGDE